MSAIIFAVLISMSFFVIGSSEVNRVVVSNARVPATPRPVADTVTPMSDPIDVSASPAE
jgi:hypothetical protein